MKLLNTLGLLILLLGCQTTPLIDTGTLEQAGRWSLEGPGRYR